MITTLGFLVFAGAMALSVGMITASIAPQWRRIIRLASGQIEEPFAPLAILAHAEQRIAVRRWASAPMCESVRRLRVAA